MKIIKAKKEDFNQLMKKTTRMRPQNRRSCLSPQQEDSIDFQMSSEEVPTKLFIEVLITILAEKLLGVLLILATCLSQSARELNQRFR